MKKQGALKTIFWISLIGVLFSGYLSYMEIFRQQCAFGGTCSTVFELPACIYGLVMYVTLLILSIIGLKSDR